MSLVLNGFDGYCRTCGRSHARGSLSLVELCRTRLTALASLVIQAVLRFPLAYDCVRSICYITPKEAIPIVDILSRVVFCTPSGAFSTMCVRFPFSPLHSLRIVQRPLFHMAVVGYALMQRKAMRNATFVPQWVVTRCFFSNCDPLYCFA
jgi:hypothetical protein